MSQIAIDLPNAARFLPMFSNFAANGAGTSIDLQQYKGDVVFVAAISQSAGAANLDGLYLQDSADNSSWSNVTNGTFNAVTNAGNGSNVGVQAKLRTVRGLQRYVRGQLNVSGANPIVGAVFAIAQPERV